MRDKYSKQHSHFQACQCSSHSSQATRLLCCSCCFAVAATAAAAAAAAAVARWLLLLLPFCFAAAAAGCLLLLRIFQPSTFRPPPSPQVESSDVVAEFLQRSIVIDTQEADVNQSNPHSFGTSVPLVFALFGSAFLVTNPCLGISVPLGLAPGGDWGMTFWKQRCHGDLALKQ